MKTFSNQPPPPSIYNAFNICPRQAWLMSRAMTADQDHEFLMLGRIIEENSFEREKKSVYIRQIGAKVDMVKRTKGKFQIIEIKKSSRTMESGIVQLKYYLYLLKKQGIHADGIIKIPKEKISKEIELSAEDEVEIESMLNKINEVLKLELPPPVKKIRQCKSCAHFEFCWA